MAEVDLTLLRLDVYDTRSGLWNPERGVIEIPDGWEFLPSGDAFVTRQVSAAGRYWLAWRPRGRGRGHRRRIGVWAPTEAIIAAGAAAEQTVQARAVRRRAGARQRERREDRYRGELRAAIVTYLDFAAEHAPFADQIADAAATRASEVGSGRVHIRHHHTDYEDVLASMALDGYGPFADADRYLDARANAHAAVDEFLAAHRKRR